MNVKVVPPTTVPVLEIVAIAGPLLVTVTVTGVGGVTGRLMYVLVSRETPVADIVDDDRRCGGHSRRDLRILRRRAEAGGRAARDVGRSSGDWLEAGRAVRSRRPRRLPGSS